MKTKQKKKSSFSKKVGDIESIFSVLAVKQFWKKLNVLEEISPLSRKQDGFEVFKNAHTLVF